MPSRRYRFTGGSFGLHKLKHITSFTFRSTNFPHPLSSHNPLNFPPIPSRNQSLYFSCFPLGVHPPHNLRIEIRILWQSIKHHSFDSPYPSKPSEKVRPFRK